MTHASAATTDGIAAVVVSYNSASTIDDCLTRLRAADGVTEIRIVDALPAPDSGELEGAAPADGDEFAYGPALVGLGEIGIDFDGALFGGADDLDELVFGDGVARFGAENVVETGLGAALVAEFLKEQERIDDGPAGVGVDDDVGLVLRRHLGGASVPFEDAAVEGVDLVEEGDLELESGSGHRIPDQFAELGHDDLFGFLDGEDRAGGDEKNREEGEGDEAAES